MEKIDYQYLGELLERAQQGDRDAFDTLYKKTYKRQYLVACSFLNDEFLAEDALQEIYLSVFEHLDSIKKPKAFISYLNAVTYTICIREKRKITERNAMISLDILTDYPDGDSKAFPENRFINGETAKELTNALSHLPEKYTQAFLLRHLEKVPLKKIAALLDCSVSSVKRYLKTAEFELHNHLEGKGFRIILWGPFLSGAFSNTADAPAKGSFINSCSSLIKKSSFSMACKTVAVIFALTCVGGGAYSIATTKPAMADTPSNVTTTPTAITQASVDTNPPIITGYNSADSNIVIYAQDDASGIDYNTVVATSVSGKSITPLSIDPQTGSMTFESPKESLTLRLTDMAGNTSESGIDISLD